MQRTAKPGALRPWRRRAEAGLGVVLCSLVLRGTAQAEDRTEAGVFTAVLAGTHVGADNPSPLNGVVPGAALEFTQHTGRLRLHLEGIPTVGASGSNDGPFGHSSASLDLLTTTALVDLDAKRRVHVGGGYQFINLTNRNGDNGDRNAVRIASPVLALGASLPLGVAGFIESNVLVAPNLRGTLLVEDFRGRSRPSKPEQGAEIDYGAAYGLRRRNIEYLLGLRALSYHTRNLDNGELVDRNVGAGATFEVRFLFGER